jgi:hypothetical protein
MGDRDACPCCGTVRDVTVDPLVAACDVLVLRALEVVGKRVCRAPDVGKDGSPGGMVNGRQLRRDEGRMRMTRMLSEGRPFHEAHLLWRVDRRSLDKALEHAWDAVPLLFDEYGCCGATPQQIAIILDRYVRDLVTAQQGHSVSELRYRFAAYLGVPS